MKVFTTYLLGMSWVNCFKTHNKLTMYPLGKLPFAPSEISLTSRSATRPSPRLVHAVWTILLFSYSCYDIANVPR